MLMYVVCCVCQATCADQNGTQSPSSCVVIDLETADDAADRSAVDTSVSAGRGSCVEPVSPVIGKFLQKATTAPPTIRHFFKPTQPENTGTVRSSENEPEGNADDVADDDNVNDVDERNQILDDNDEEVFITKMSECRQVTNRPVCLTKESTVLQTQGNGCTTAASGKSVTKRSNNGKLPAGKKPKQSNIQAMFTSAARNPQKRPGTMQCPICSRVFDDAVSNADVNLHIDSCLIE